MKNYSMGQSGAYTNYYTAFSSQPLYFRPLPGCNSKLDVLWVAQIEPVTATREESASPEYSI